MRRSLTWIVALLLLAACKTNPHTGRVQTLLISEAQEIKLGKQAWAEMTGPKSKIKTDTRPAWSDPLQRVGRAIAIAADKTLIFPQISECIRWPTSSNPCFLPMIMRCLKSLRMTTASSKTV